MRMRHAYSPYYCEFICKYIYYYYHIVDVRSARISVTPFDRLIMILLYRQRIHYNIWLYAFIDSLARVYFYMIYTNTNNCKSAKQASEHRRGGLCVYIIMTISIIIHLHVPSLLPLAARSQCMTGNFSDKSHRLWRRPPMHIAPYPSRNNVPICPSLPNRYYVIRYLEILITVIREYFGRCRRAGYMYVLGGGKR